MKLGFSLPTAGAWATPENQIRVARQAETLGYHSLWVFQRLLYALDPKNEYPPVPGKTWPKPFVSVRPHRHALLRGRGHLAHPPRHERADHALLHPGGPGQAARHPRRALGRPARRRAGPRLVGGRVRGGRGPVQGARAPRRRVPPVPRHDLDPGRDRVPRRVLSRAALPGGAQAGAEAPPADHHRRLRPHGGEARGRAGRRVQRWQRADGERGPAGARGPGGGGRAWQGSGPAPHRLPRLLPGARDPARSRPPAALGHDRRDPRGHRPLRGRRPHRAVPRGQLRAGRAVARADPGRDDAPRPRRLVWISTYFCLVTSRIGPFFPRSSARAPSRRPARQSGPRFISLVTGSVSFLSGSVKDIAIAATASPAKRSYFIWLANDTPGVQIAISSALFLLRRFVMDDSLPSILCVDDDVDIIDLLKEYFTEQGFVVLTATNGVEAFLQVKRWQPKAVILDLFMPRLGGIGALGRIKALNPDVVVILVSGMGNALELVTEAGLSVAGAFAKPLDLMQVSETLARAGVVAPSAFVRGETSPERRPVRARILVVDDELEFRKVLAEYLEDRGFDVIEAQAGEEALDRIPDFHPHIVLMDVMMAGMGGIEALRRIKVSAPETCVIMVTAVEDIDSARGALALGASDYVTKPFSFQYLDSVLEVHMLMDHIDPKSS